MKQTQWPVRTSVCFSKAAYRKIRVLSKLKGVSISDMVRTAVRFYLENVNSFQGQDTKSRQSTEE